MAGYQVRRRRRKGCSQRRYILQYCGWGNEKRSIGPMVGLACVEARRRRASLDGGLGHKFQVHSFLLLLPVLLFSLLFSTAFWLPRMGGGDLSVDCRQSVLVDGSSVLAEEVSKKVREDGD